MKIILSNSFIKELINLFILENDPDTPDSKELMVRTTKDVEELMIFFFNGEVDKTELSYEVYNMLDMVYLESITIARLHTKKSVEAVNPVLLTGNGDMLIELI